MPENYALEMCKHLKRASGGVRGMEGEKFSLHKEAMTFTRPIQYKSFAVPAIRVKKMLPNSTQC
jgi:hypothetical protein